MSNTMSDELQQLMLEQLNSPLRPEDRLDVVMRVIEAYKDDACREMLDMLSVEYLKLLTIDSKTHDARRKDFNQAIFDADNGYAIFNGTDLRMIMDKFESAKRNNLKSEEKQR